MNGKAQLARFIAEQTSQTQFARQVGCSESHLSLILSGDRKASADLATRISAATNGVVTARALVSDKVLLDPEPAPAHEPERAAP